MRVDKLSGNGGRFFILEPARDLEEKKKPQSVLWNSPGLLQLVHRIGGQLALDLSCEPFMGRTLGPLDVPRLILGGRLK